MMLRCVQALAMRAALMLCTPAAAMFEDQAGAYDWYKPFVGPVTSAALHSKIPRLFLGTQRNVVGSLHLRDGNIAWRRLLDDGDTVDSTMLIETPVTALLSLSGNGTFLRAWDQVDGALKWQLNLRPTKEAPTAAITGDVSPQEKVSAAALSSGAAAAATKPAMAVRYAVDGTVAEIVVVSHGQLKVWQVPADPPKRRSSHFCWHLIRPTSQHPDA
jgi:hypothetical protein